MFRSHILASVCIALVAIVGLSVPVAAQDEIEIPALERVLTLTYESSATAAPTIENGIFQITDTGELSGDLSGTYTQDITQLIAYDQQPAAPISAFFTIETDEGTLEGFVIGYYYVPQADSDSADYVGHGRILSVSGSYADFYLAEVYLNSTVTLMDGQGVANIGTITIAPRY